MKKISVAKRASAMLIALVLLVSCVLTVSAGTAYTGDDGSGQTTVKLASSGGGTINYDINGIASYTSGHYLNSGVPLGEVCTASARSTSTRRFAYWIDEFGSRIFSYDPAITFTAGSRVSYKAVFNTAKATQRMVQYFNYGGNTLLSKFIVTKGTTITQPDNPYVAGFTFRRWSSTIDEVNASEEDMLVTPIFDVKKETYTVTLTNDAYVSGAGSYPNYATVNLQAEAKNGAGEPFAYWKNSDGQIVSYERNYSFRINYNTTLTAVYGESVTPEPVVRISRVYRDPSAYTLTVFAERSVPDGYTVVSHGILMAASDTADSGMTVGSGEEFETSSVRKVYGNSNEPCGTFSVAKRNLMDETTVTARPFLIYQDATGKEFIVYGDTLRTTNAG